MRLASVAGAAVLLAVGSAWAAEGDSLTVTGDGVNVRNGPSTSDRVIMRVYRGREAIEIARDGEWVRVELAGSGGQEGWIHSSLLAPAGGAAATAPSPAPDEAVAADTPRPAAPAPPEPAGTRPGGAEGVAAGEQADVPELGETSPPAGGTGPDVAAVEVRDGAGGIEPAAGPDAGGPELDRFRESVTYLNSRALQVAGVDLFTEVEVVDEQTVMVGITDAWTTVPPAGQRSYLNTLVDRWSAANGGVAPVSVRIVDEEGEVLAEQSGP
ncbi:MAG TPA: SH3 domain-containing protein [Geminicoccaceae bacterium]